MFRTIFKNHFGLVCLLASLFYCTETIAVENAITNHAPVTSSVNSATLTNTSASIFLVASDADYDNLTYFIVSQPSNGTITLSGANVTYTPNTGFTGTDTFTFKANDSFLDSNVETVTISVFNSYLSQPSQIGQDLVGENSSDLLGNAISFNEDRTIMAIGAKNYANNKGVVKVYKNINGTWSIMGSAIVGSAINMYHGFSIDLSSNGMRLAVGIPGYNNFKGMVRIYEYTNGTWSQMGSDLTFNQDSARFGWSVSFTADAEKIAIGAWGYNNERGAVWFYEYQSSNWEYLAIIQGSSGGIEYGKAIAYSSDGSRLLVGAPNYNIGKGFAKFLRNFNVLDGSLGYNLQSILPFTNSENFGSAVTMSSKGDMVAIAEIAYDNSKGLVRVYRYGTYGLDLIHTFTGQSAGDLFGNSISISSDGKALVIGAPGANSNNGKVSLYRFQNNQWSASGTQLIGQNGEKLGTTVELSSDGTAVAVGAVAYDYEKGVVRVYDLKNNVPEATADTFLVEANSSNNFIDVLANDSDTDGDEIYLVDVSTTGTGSVSITNEGTINYTPAPNFAGIETINYNVSDGIQSSTSTLTVFVLDPTDTFISASNVNAATLKNQQAKIHLVANALLYNAINYVILSNPTNGTLSQNGANVIYTPNPGFLGSDSFSYKASYGSSESEIKTVSIDVIDSFTLTNKQVGDDLVGQNTGDKMGSSVSFNENHTLMAVGAYRLGSNKGKVTLYEFIDNAWQQTSTIEGSANQEGFGYTVDLSASGTKLAVGLIQINNDKGAVRVFEKNSTSWTQIGSDINGVNVNDEFGGSISLSSDGNRIAIGAQYHLQSFGQAKVFEFKNSNWVQLGASITGIDGDNLGKTVSLSSDGTILAVGAPYHNSFSGVVKIFKLTDSEWAPLGNQIEGTPDGLSIIGESISLSSDGQTIATSLNYNIRVYSLINNQWTIVGGDIQPDFSGNMFVSISSDGKTLGVATFIQGSSSECAASVYRLENEAWSQIGETITEELVNGSGVAIDVSSDGTFFAFGSPGYDQSKGLVKVYNLKVNAPVTNDDTATVLEDAVLTSINVVANDTDADGDELELTAVTTSGSGTVAINADTKSIDYTPALNFFGTEIINYTITDGVYEVTTGILTVNVTAVNDEPEVVNDNLIVLENSVLVEIDVLANDSDEDTAQEDLYITLVNTDGSGTVEIDSESKSINYMSAPNFNGTEILTYTVSDGESSVSGIVTIVVTPSSEYLSSLSYISSATTINTPTTIHLIAEDLTFSDLNYVITTNPLHGTFALTDDKVLYTPASDFTGEDFFTYKVISDSNESDIQIVKINVFDAIRASVNQNEPVTVGEEGDLLGHSVSLSSDGSVVAIGSAFSEYSYQGSVTIYQKNGSNWDQLGNKIVGPSSTSGFGSSVSLSSDGRTILVGVPRSFAPDGNIRNASIVVYELIGATWEQKGGINYGISFLGSGPTDEFGRVTSISSSGNVICSSIPNYNFSPWSYHQKIGIVSIYSYDGSSWNKLGDDILGKFAQDKSGSSVSLSSDGSVVAIGSTNNDGGGSNSGHVRIFKYNGNDWQLKGTDINGEATGDQSGGAVSLSLDGSVVAIGAINNDGGGSNSGHVRIFEYNGVNWQQKGADINGQAGDKLGSSVSLSSDGETVAIGAKGSNGEGYVSVFRYINGVWTSQINPIVGLTQVDDDFLLSVALSKDGSALSIGSPYNNLGGNNAGTARVFKLFNYNLIANSDSASVLEDNLLTKNVLANDTDADYEILELTEVSTTGTGTVLINEDRESVDYTPATNFNGTEVITYTVSDGDYSTTETLTVTVTPVNDAPIAVADTSTVEEDASLTVINVIDNDTDAEGDELELTAVTTAGSGTVAINEDGKSVNYTPASNFNGTEVITYTVSDGELSDATGTLTITVSPVNDAPTAIADAFMVLEDAALTAINVIANDTDEDGDELELTAVSTAGSGLVAINADGVSVNYTPAINFNGTEVITYTVSDGEFSDATGTLTIAVTTVNDAPNAVADTATVMEDASLTVINVIDDDTDAEGDELELTAVSTSGSGTVAINADGVSVNYTPATNFNGTEVITYTVSDGDISVSGTLTVTVTSINDAPIAEADTATVLEDAALTAINVIDNDTDTDGDELELTAISTAGSGTVAINEDGKSVNYTPAANFNGTEVVTYTVSDGELSDTTGTLTVTITPVNDAPVVVGDTATVLEDAALIAINVIDNDTDADGDELELTAVTTAGSGTVAINEDGKSINYTPATNFNGTELITYTVSDGELSDATGTLTITVTPVNDAPVANADTATVIEDAALTTINVLANDIDVDNDAIQLTAVSTAGTGSVILSANDASIDYKPAANFNGTEVITYTITAGSDTVTGTLTVTVTPVNDAAPTIIDIAAATEKNTTAKIHLVANDADYDQLTYSLVSIPENGTAILTGDTVVYTPNTNFSGEDSFTYKVNDGIADSSTKTVSIKVFDAFLADARQLGNTLTGSAAYDFFGSSVSYSADGTIVAVSSTGSDDAGYDAGKVEVYAFNGSSWQIIGSPILGEEIGEEISEEIGAEFGYFVSLSADGSSVAVSSFKSNKIKIYAFNGTDWQQKGTDISLNITYLYGSSYLYAPYVSLSANGNIIAVEGMVGNYVKKTQVYAFDGFSWSQLGSDIIHNTSEDIPSVNSNLSASGYTLVVGALKNSESNEEFARVYSFNGSDWVQLGEDIVKPNATTANTYSVSISSDGTIIALGDVVNEEVSIFSYNGSSWNQLGASISTGALNENFGFYTSLSADGNRIAISAPGSSSSVSPGTAWVYTYNGSSWQQLGSAITGVAANDYLGYSISLSADGTRLAVGARFNDDIDTNAGHVRIFNLINYIPTSVADTATVLEDAALTAINVIANDTDTDGDELELTAVTTAGSGTVAINEDGKSVNYTPAANFNGTEVVTYTVSDGELSDVTGTLTVTVTPVNDAPIAVADTTSVEENSTATPISVLINDTDVDGNTLSITTVTSAGDGSVSINSTNTEIIYTPLTDFVGTEVLTYTVTDTEFTSTTTVTVTVTEFNEPPVAVADVYTVAEDSEQVSINVIANDTDLNQNDVLFLTEVSTSGTGMVSINPNTLSVDYMPGHNFYGTEVINYTVSDGMLFDQTGTLTITVTPVNDLPFANSDYFTIEKNSGLYNLNVLLNDFDPDGDSLIITEIFNNTAIGTAAINTNGTAIEFTPPTDFIGTVEIHYTISDNEYQDPAGIITIEVVEPSQDIIWSSQYWSNNVGPSITQNAFINDNLTLTENLSCNDLTISPEMTLIVPPNVVLTVDGMLMNDGTIIFKSDATGTGIFGAYNHPETHGQGVVKVEQYVGPKRAWRMLTSPLKGFEYMTIFENWQNNGQEIAGTGMNLFSADGGNGLHAGGSAYSIKKYPIVAGQTSWVDITNTFSEPLFEPERNNAFAVFTTGPYTTIPSNINSGSAETIYKATGKLITGDVVYDNLPIDVHSFIGNPYVSPINPAAIFSDNTDFSQLWVWDPSLSTLGAYLVYDALTGWSNTTESYSNELGSETMLQSGQAFFVKPATTASLIIKETQKSSMVDNGVFFKTSSSTVEQIRVTLSKDVNGTVQNEDAAVIALYANADNAVTVEDAEKLTKGGENISILNNQSELTVEHRSPAQEQDELQLYLYGMNDTSVYSLNLNTKDYLGLQPYLWDRLSDNYYTIPTDGSMYNYSFTMLDPEAEKERFRVVFDSTLSSSTLDLEQIMLYPNPVNDGVLIVTLPNSLNNIDFTIVNILGQTVTQGLLQSGANQVELNIAAGVYNIVLKSDSKNNITKRLIVK